MKFFCDNCGKKYLIPDEMVKGKVLQVRCKVCSHVIEVRENATHAPQGAQDAAGQIGWYYAVGGQTQGPFPLGELRAKFSNREVGDDAYVWNETFTQWLPATSCDEFKGYFQGTALRPPRPTTSLRAIDIESALNPQNQAPAPQPARPSMQARPVQQHTSKPAQKPVAAQAQAATPRSSLASPAKKPISRPGLSSTKGNAPANPVDFKERLRKLREKAHGSAASPAASSLPKPSLSSPTAPKTSTSDPKPSQTPLPTPQPSQSSASSPVDRVEASPFEETSGPEAVDPPTTETPRKDLSDLFSSESKNDPFGLSSAPSADPFGLSSAPGTNSHTPALSTPEEPKDEAPPVEASPSLENSEQPAPLPPVEEPTEEPEAEEDKPSYTLFPPAEEESKSFFPPPEESSYLQETAFTPDLDNDPAAAFDDKPTPSLLIQLNEIEQNQKKTRQAAIFIAIGVLLLLVVGMSAYILLFEGKTSENAEAIIQAAEENRKANQNKDRYADFEKIKGYDKEQLKSLTFVDLDEGEEAVDLKNAPVEEDDPEDTTNPTAVAKAPTKNPAGAAKKAPAVAKQTPKGTKEPKDSKDPKKGSIFGSGVNLRGSGDALDKSLATAKTTDKGKEKRGLADTARTESVGKAEKIAVKTDPSKLKTGNPDAVYNKFFEGARRDPVNVEKRRSGSGEAPSSGALPTGLTRQQLVAGFKSVRRSATQCLERHTKRSGDRLPTSKVKITVTINGSGKVGGLIMSGGVSNTVFGTCMSSKKGGWRFPAFQGPPIKVARTFILQ